MPKILDGPTSEDVAKRRFERPLVGDRMKDGSIFAGLSPDTGKPMYATPADAPLKMKWQEAMKYAANLEAHGHGDWRLPSRTELNVLFNNRMAIGGFDSSGGFDSGGSLSAGSYWSSAAYGGNGAWFQRFSDGYRDGIVRNAELSVRCVRG